MKSRKKQATAVVMATTLALTTATTASPALAYAQEIDGTQIKANVSAGSKGTTEISAQAADGLAIDAVNFPDKRFRQYIKDNFDEDKDGSLSQEEIAAVTLIDIQDVDYKAFDTVDLTGLNLFTNLQTLYCRSITHRDTMNGIGKIDVSGLTNLQTLSCTESDVDTLNLSGCTGLKQLYCYETDITSLDIRDCSSLQYLDCSSLNIESLDVSQCTNLETLYCNRTNITNLDVNGLNKLKLLNCRNTGITSLDVNGLGRLETLDCSDTSITNLDVNGLGSLRSLNCSDTNIASLDVNGLGELRSLYCSGTNITSLDVSSLRSLRSLDCSDTDITSLDVSSLTSLWSLYCSDINITSLDVSQCADLETLSCSGTNITSLDVSPCTDLEILISSDTNITSLDVSKNTKLMILDVENCNLAYLNIGENSNLYVNGGSAAFNKTVGRTFNITEMFEGIDVSRIASISGAELNKTTGIVSGYTGTNPIVTYVYDCDGSGSGTQTITVTLNLTLKPESTITFREDSLNMTYTGNPISLTKDDCTVTGSSGDVTFTYEKQETEGSWATLDSAPDNAGIYRVRATVAEDDVYSDADSEWKEFRIEKADNEWKTNLAITGWTYGAYDEDNNAPSASAEYGDVTFTYSSSEDGEFTEDVPTTAGIWYVKATVAETENYTGLSAAKQFTIKQAANSWREEIAITGWTYGAYDEDNNAPSASAEYGDVTFTYSSSEDGEFTEDVPTTAGTWYVKAEVMETVNYAGLESDPVSFRIAKAMPDYEVPQNLTTVYGQFLSDVRLPDGFSWKNDSQSVGDAGTNTFMAVYTPGDTDNYLTVEDIPITLKVTRAANSWVQNLTIESWTYKEEANTPTASAEYGDVTFTYSSSEDGIFTEDVPATAGTWYVKASVMGTVNYAGLESEPVSFRIAKAAPDYEVPQNLTAAYGQLLAVVGLPDGFSWKNDSQSVGSAGTNTFMAAYTPGDTDNYLTIENIPITVKVIQATNSWTKKLSVDDWTYKEEANTPTASAEFGTVVFTYSDSENGEFTSDVPATAGTWYVKAEVAETADYKGLSAVEAFVIEKAAAPEIVLPDNLSAVQDDILSSVTLPEGWTWVDGTQKVTVNNSGYKARLVIDDKNYDYTGTEGYNAGESYVERTLTVTVSQRQNTWSIEPSISDWTYNETASTPMGTAGHGTVAFTYSDSPTGEFTSDVPTRAGTWYMKASVQASDEYTGLNEIVKFTIYKTTPHYDVPDNLTAVYSQTLKDIELPEGFTWADNTLSVGNAGAHTFKAVYTPEDTENYVVIEDIDITVTVLQAENTWTEELAVMGWTYGAYDEEKNAPYSSARYGDVVYVYSNQKDGTYTSDIPTEAGTWYVKTIVEETADYAGLESEAVAFTIEPKSGSTIAAPDINENTDLDNYVMKDGDTTLVADRDYDITKKQDGDIVTITITFKGNYTGTVTKTCKVSSASNSDGLSGSSETGENNNTDNKDISDKNTSAGESPSTGDNANMSLWGSLLSLSGGFLALLTGKRRRKPKQED